MALTDYTDISDLTAAYAMRKVVAAYTGDCLRLRRSADNAEQDFGFDENGDLDVAAIAAWLASDTGYVVTWYDQSGNGHDAEQSTTTKQPTYIASGINGLPTLSFDGTDDYFVVDSMASTFNGDTKPTSIMATVRPTVDSSYNALWSISRSSTLVYRGLFCATNTNYLQLNQYSDAASPNTYSSVRGLVNATAYIVGQTYGANAATPWINGTCEQPPSAMNGTFTVDRASIGLVHQQASYNYPYQGYLSEFAIYAAMLSSTVMRDVFEFQNAYYELVTPQRARADNAASPLTTPTYDGSGQAIHPSVYDAREGNTVDSYRYWMVMTPYPGNNAAYENPSILVSNDGESWSVPSGGSNPISTPSSGNYGDTHLLLAEDGDWYVYWFHNTSLDTVKCSSSSDGITWSSPVDVITGNNVCGSPVVFWDGEQYVMYTLDTTSNPHQLNRRTSSDPISGWSSAETIPMPMMAGRQVWDFNILYDADSGTYFGFFTYIHPPTGGSTVCFFGTSEDGETWTLDEYPLLNPSTSSSAWDSNLIYRSAPVISDTGFDLWYSARQSGTVWRTGFTTVTFTNGDEPPPPPPTMARAYAVVIV